MTKKGQARLFTTTFDCFNRTHIDENRRGLFKGVSIQIAYSLCTAMLFPIYEVVKRQEMNMSSNPKVQHFMERIGTALSASMISGLLLYPLDTAKRCAQLNGGRGSLTLYNSIPDLFRNLMGKGIGTFYRGVHLYLLKTLIMSYLYVSMYEVVRTPFGLE